MPKSLTLIEQAEPPTRLHGLELQEAQGIGKRTLRHLRVAGIFNPAEPRGARCAAHGMEWRKRH